MWLSVVYRVHWTLHVERRRFAPPALDTHAESDIADIYSDHSPQAHSIDAISSRSMMLRLIHWTYSGTVREIDHHVALPRLSMNLRSSGEAFSLSVSPASLCDMNLTAYNSSYSSCSIPRKNATAVTAHVTEKRTSNASALAVRASFLPEPFSRIIQAIRVAILKSLRMTNTRCSREARLESLRSFSISA